MSENKFLCDQMILDLGRWLRAAGYDSVFIEKGEKDQEILVRALAEKRWLLTRDSEFLEMKRAESVLIFLGQYPLEACVGVLNKLLKIDWLFCPFSRCLICNSVLIKPNDEIVKKNVPQDLQIRTDQFWYCEHCRKVYWEGSHTKRMLKQLKKWSEV